MSNKEPQQHAPSRRKRYPKISIASSRHQQQQGQQHVAEASPVALVAPRPPPGTATLADVDPGRAQAAPSNAAPHALGASGTRSPPLSPAKAPLDSFSSFSALPSGTKPYPTLSHAQDQQAMLHIVGASQSFRAVQQSPAQQPLPSRLTQAVVNQQRSGGGVGVAHSVPKAGGFLTSRGEDSTEGEREHLRLGSEIPSVGPQQVGGRYCIWSEKAQCWLRWGRSRGVVREDGLQQSGPLVAVPGAAAGAGPFSALRGTPLGASTGVPTSLHSAASLGDWVWVPVPAALAAKDMSQARTHASSSQAEPRGLLGRQQSASQGVEPAGWAQDRATPSASGAAPGAGPGPAPVAGGRGSSVGATDRQPGIHQAGIDPASGSTRGESPGNPWLFTRELDDSSHGSGRRIRLTDGGSSATTTGALSLPSSMGPLTWLPPSASTSGSAQPYAPPHFARSSHTPFLGRTPLALFLMHCMAPAHTNPSCYLPALMAPATCPAASCPMSIIPTCPAACLPYEALEAGPHPLPCSPGASCAGS